MEFFYEANVWTAKTATNILQLPRSSIKDARWRQQSARKRKPRTSTNTCHKLHVMASVQVLCPNGHRSTVKVTPNTKILQILEEVCTKKGFLPPEEYALRQGRKVLDLSQPFRYSGLPNHAHLELFKTEEARSEAQVGIALQLESGKRLQHDFVPSVTSLWQVLEHFESVQDEGSKLTEAVEGKHPVMIYMREEVIGEFALKETTLKVLGLTQGKAILRLTHRAVDENVLQDIKAKIEKEKARLARLASKIQAQTSTDKTEEQKIESQNAETKSSEDSMECQEKKASEEKMECDKKTASKESMECDEKKDSKESMECEEKKDSKESMECDEKKDSKESMECEDKKPSEENMECADDGQPSTSQAAAHSFGRNEADEEKARRLAQVVMPGLLPAPKKSIVSKKQGQSSQSLAVLPRQPPQQPFSNFKFPEATKGQDLYRNEFSEVNREEYKPCERDPVLFSIDQINRKSVSEEIPDTFFEVTESDVKKMWADLQKKVQIQEEQMLLTSSLRKLQEERRCEKYERAIIRFHFPDQHVLQAIFRPKETVFALKKFLQNHLDDEAKKIFYLYTTPPKQMLRDDLTLIEAHLVPMSFVYVGFQDQPKQFLTSELLGQKANLELAENTVMQHMASVSEAAIACSSQDQPSKRTGESQKAIGSSSSGTAEKKVPKWFKMGPK